jgi:hypothetical protein
MILVVATIGVNVNVQYCYGQYIGVQINGLHFLTEAGAEMTCCQDDENGCDGCEHIHHQYQIQSQYMSGEGVSIAPAQTLSDWLHGDFPYVIIDKTWAAEEGSDSKAGFYDPPPCYDNAVILQRGLRAPPIWT